MASAGTPPPLGWFGVFRLGLVQAALGAIVIVTTSTLNRVMVVELALPAMLPGALVGWHYAIQISRPHWGHGADKGGRRGPWILGGLAVLGVGAILAAMATAQLSQPGLGGFALAFIAFTLIGAGVGAAGTNQLALLAARTPPSRKAAAAAIVWIMMIVGFVITAATVGAVLDPFSLTRLVYVTAGVSVAALVVASLAIVGLEPRARADSAGVLAETAPAAGSGSFRDVLAEVWADPPARRFTIFVFVSMLAYSAQDLILEPFAGLIYGYTPGESTALAGTQNGGVLIGMIITAIAGTVIGKSSARFMRAWTVGGCIASAFSLAALAAAARMGTALPLEPLVFVLGLSNGAFAVAAIGSMMTLASAGPAGREGIRMGLWGASQAMAFGLGGFLGAVALDVMRVVLGDVSGAFFTVFAAEGALFAVAAGLALRVGETGPSDIRLPALPAGEHLPAE
ncbi:MAG: BCD family MFS transporter [Pseudomonadota bacterium]